MARLLDELVCTGKIISRERDLRKIRNSKAKSPEYISAVKFMADMKSVIQRLNNEYWASLENDTYTHSKGTATKLISNKRVTEKQGKRLAKSYLYIRGFYWNADTNKLVFLVKVQGIESCIKVSPNKEIRGDKGETLDLWICNAMRYILNYWIESSSENRPASPHGGAKRATSILHGYEYRHKVA